MKIRTKEDKLIIQAPLTQVLGTTPDVVKLIGSMISPKGERAARSDKHYEEYLKYRSVVKDVGELHYAIVAILPIRLDSARPGRLKGWTRLKRPEQHGPFTCLYNVEANITFPIIKSFRFNLMRPNGSYIWRHNPYELIGRCAPYLYEAMKKYDEYGTKYEQLVELIIRNGVEWAEHNDLLKEPRVLQST